MRFKTDPLSEGTHRKVAGYLFNHTWALLDRKQRTPVEDDEMLHGAHASRYHWAQVGRPVNLAVGEWQISRVYSALGRAEPALYHARRALTIAQRGRLGRFYVAYAYEALARAEAIGHRKGERDRYLRLAGRIGGGIRSRDDRRMLLEDLATIG